MVMENTDESINPSSSSKRQGQVGGRCSEEGHERLGGKSEDLHFILTLRQGVRWQGVGERPEEVKRSSKSALECLQGQALALSYALDLPTILWKLPYSQ